MIAAPEYSQLVQETLGAALASGGFRLDQEDPYRVRFRRASVFVDAIYDAGHSRELFIWVGRDDDGAEPPLSLPDAVRAAGCDDRAVARVAGTQSGDSGFLAGLLRDAAALLLGPARPFLEGDAAAFEVAHRQRSERARAYTAELNNRGALAEADQAWEAKDYARVSSVLGSLRGSLDEPHRRRLEFAEKRRD